MMNSTAKTTVRVLLCAGFGWLAGEAVSGTLLQTSPKRPDESNGGVVAGAKAEEGRDTVSEWQAFLAARNIPQGFAMSDVLDAAGMLENSRGKLVLTDSESRLGIMRQLVRCSPEDFPRLLKLVESMTDARMKRQMAEAFFAAWAQHDPQAAIEAADRIPGLSMAGLNGALKTWVEKDPRGLMVWLRDPTVYGWARMQARTNAFVYLTESDPGLAMQLATESGRAGARQGVFINWYRRDPKAAEAWIAAATADERRQMFPSWAGARSGTDPAGAWQLVLTEAPEQKQVMEVLPVVFGAWLEKDTAAAREALTKVPADMWEPKFATLTGTMLGNREAPELDRMAEKVPDKARTPFWAGVASGAVESGKSAEFAAAAFAHLPVEDSDERMDLADRITDLWVKTDARTASGWVQALPQGRTRDMAAAALAEGLILTDPGAAARWAADIRSDRMRADVQGRLTKRSPNK
ncbi:MAG TPA: hypothetical protein VG796_01910 [Verrucomicrobiales bacterium]|nr:hypothetical protein [Verrucomicrobiales bacterium]